MVIGGARGGTGVFAGGVTMSGVGMVIGGVAMGGAGVVAGGVTMTASCISSEVLSPNASNTAWLNCMFVFSCICTKEVKSVTGDLTQGEGQVHLMRVF